MKNVLIIGASGGIAQIVVDLLEQEDGINLSLFLRNTDNLKNKNTSKHRIIEGDVMDIDKLKEATIGQEIVYVNLAGDLEEMMGNIIEAMRETRAKHLIFISSIEIYDIPLKPVLVPYRKATDLVEESGLEYTILRPTWFSDLDEVDYETTEKNEPERGSTISRKSLATLIMKIIKSPESYAFQNLGVNKPNS